MSELPNVSIPDRAEQEELRREDAHRTEGAEHSLAPHCPEAAVNHNWRIAETVKVLQARGDLWRLIG